MFLEIFLDINLCIIWNILEVKEKTQDNRYNDSVLLVKLILFRISYR